MNIHTGKWPWDMNTSVNIINNNFKNQDTLFSIYDVLSSDISCGYTLLLIENILSSLAIKFSDLFITSKLIQSKIVTKQKWLVFKSGMF